MARTGMNISHTCQRWSLALVCFVATLGMTSAAYPQVDPTNQSVIVWGDLPPIPEASNQTSAASRPGLLAQMAEEFVDLVQPQGIPFDYVTFLLQNTVYNQTDYYQENWQSEIWKIMGLFVGIVVCVLFGILYCLVLPPTGLFFSCCRCCDQCGGKRVQKETKHMGCKRVTLSLFFFSITGIICAGMAFTNVSNEFIQDSVDEVKVIADTSLVDLESYFNGANEQLDYMYATEYTFIDQLLRDNLDHIGVEIGGPLEEYLLAEAGLQDVIDGVNNVSTTLSEMEATMLDISSLQESLLNDSSTLQSQLEAVQTNLNNINAGCGDCVPGVDQLNMIEDFTQLPTLDTQIQGVTEANDVLVNITQEIDTVLDEIPTQITNQSQDSVQQALESLDEVSQEVSQSFSEVSQIVSDVASTLASAKEELDGAWENYAQDYSQYVYYALIGLTCTILLIVMFNLIGMTMGTFSYKNVMPTERSRMSNAGGNVLMAGVFFTFLFAPILMILTCAMFSGLSAVTLLCGPLLSYQAFNETIDQPNVIVDGYYLGEVLLGNSSIPLTVTGVLTNCDNDASAYEAFQLDSLYDLDSVKQQLDELQAEVDRLVDEINPSELDYDIPFADFISELEKLVNTTELGNINYTQYNEVLSLGVTSVDLVEYATNLTQIAAGQSQAVADDINEQVVTLITIQTGIVDPMQDSVNQIQSDLSLIQELEAMLNAGIDGTVDAVAVADAALSSNATSEAVIGITQDYADRLVDYGNQFYFQIERQITSDFGKCKLVASVYAYSIKSSCDYPIASLNTLWFTIGWCVFFYVPSIILAVKLAKYYRIMDEEAPYRAPKSKSTKKKKKGKESSRRDSDEEMALDDMDAGADHLHLVDNNSRPTSMMAQQNPHYVPDEPPIMAYNDLGRPMAPPPAYNPAYPRGAPPTLPSMESFQDSGYNRNSGYHGNSGRPESGHYGDDHHYEMAPFQQSGLNSGQQPPPASNRQSFNMYSYNNQQPNDAF